MSDLLGRMLLITIREDIRMPFSTLHQSWDVHALPKDLAPRLRSVEDAFRRATPRRQWKDGLALLSYTGTHHKEDDSRLETILVYSADDTHKVDLHHTNRAVLYLSGDELKYEPFTPLTQTEVGYIEEIQNRFAITSRQIDGSQCRNAIARVISQAQALAYRDGSYLVGREHFTLADGLVGFISDLQPYTKGEPNVIWDIPYIDTKDTRRQIQQALMEHIQRTTSQVLTEVRSLKPRSELKKNVGRDRRQTLLTQLNDISRVISNYAALLGHELPTHRQALSIALAQYYQAI